MRTALGLYVFSLLIALAVGSASNSTDVCFSTVLFSTDAELNAVQLPNMMCPVWKLDYRVVHAAQLDDDSVALIASYPYASSAQKYFYQTYDTAGALLSSVELKTTQTLSGDSEMAFCETHNDLFIGLSRPETSGTLMLHFDKHSGAAKPLVSYAKLEQSHRSWLVCSPDYVFVSVLADNAVWQLDASNGLLLRIVARVQSPGALTINKSGSLIRVASGQPALRIYTFDLATGANRNTLRLDGAAPLRGIEYTSSTPVRVTALTTSGRIVYLRDLDSPLPSVDAAMVPAIERASILLADGRTCVVDNVVLDIVSGAPWAALSASTLTNTGNLDRLVSVHYAPGTGGLLLADQQGKLVSMSAVERSCPVLFERYEPALLGPQPRIMFVDTEDPYMPLVYTTDAARTVLVLRRQTSMADGELMWNGTFCPGGTSVLQAVFTAWPDAFICALCSHGSVICEHLNELGTEHAVPARMDITLVRLEWSPTHEQLYLFYAGTEILSLELNAPNAAWTPVGTVALGSEPFDPLYWSATHSAGAVYAMRINMDTVVFVDGYEFAVLRAIKLDHRLSTAAAQIVLVPASSSTDDEDWICTGPGNGTVRNNVVVNARTPFLISLGSVLMVTGFLLAMVFACFAFTYRTRFIGSGGYAQLEENNFAERSSLLVRATCGQTAQELVYMTLSWYPTLANAVTAAQQRTLSPVRSGSVGQVQLDFTTDARPPPSAASANASNDLLAAAREIEMVAPPAASPAAAAISAAISASDASTQTPPPQLPARQSSPPPLLPFPLPIGTPPPSAQLPSASTSGLSASAFAFSDSSPMP